MLVNDKVKQGGELGRSVRETLTGLNTGGPSHGSVEEEGCLSAEGEGDMGPGGLGPLVPVVDFVVLQKKRVGGELVLAGPASKMGLITFFPHLLEFSVERL